MTRCLASRLLSGGMVSWQEGRTEGREGRNDGRKGGKEAGREGGREGRNEGRKAANYIVNSYRGPVRNVQRLMGTRESTNQKYNRFRRKGTFVGTQKST